MADPPGARAARGTSAAAYARRVERLWGELLERPVILSPRDWTLVSSWHARGIPLAIVREAIVDALARRRRQGSRTARGLSYLAPAVEEGWAVVVAGRLAAGGGATRPPRPTAEDAWRARLAREPDGSALARLLRELLARLDDGEPGERIDRDLDDGLEASAPDDVVRQVRAEVDRDLEPYHARIPRERLEATGKRARIVRLRRRLKLPPLPRG